MTNSLSEINYATCGIRKYCSIGDTSDSDLLLVLHSSLTTSQKFTSSELFLNLIITKNSSTYEKISVPTMLQILSQSRNLKCQKGSQQLLSFQEQQYRITPGLLAGPHYCQLTCPAAHGHCNDLIIPISLKSSWTCMHIRQLGTQLSRFQVVDTLKNHAQLLAKCKHTTLLTEVCIKNTAIFQTFHEIKLGIKASHFSGYH